MGFFNSLNLFRGRPSILPIQRRPMVMVYSMYFTNDEFTDELNFTGQNVEWLHTDVGVHSMNCLELFRDGQVHPVITPVSSQPVAYTAQLTLGDGIMVIRFLDMDGAQVDVDFMIALFLRH